LASAAIDE
jgi:hypothetical protein